MRLTICIPLFVAAATSLATPAWAASPPSAAATAAPASAATPRPHAGPMAGMPMPKAKPKAPVVPEKLVDINSASKAELKTLPGIGDAEADKIIKNRPYLTKTELVDKGVLREGPYLSLRHKVIAFQKGRTKIAKPSSAAPAARAASAPRKP